MKKSAPFKKHFSNFLYAFFTFFFKIPDNRGQFKKILFSVLPIDSLKPWSLMDDDLQMVASSIPLSLFASYLQPKYKICCIESIFYIFH